jgi:Dockerin type I domain/Pregnancy-associated plasma protein-A
MKSIINFGRVSSHSTLPFLCLLMTFVSLRGQNFKCGTAPTTAQMAVYTNRLAGSVASPQLPPGGLTYTIPIQLWISRTLVDINAIYETINQVNSKFSFYNGARFDLCKVSYITDYQIVAADSSLQQQSMFNAHNTPNMINMYLVNDVYRKSTGESIGGFASFPDSADTYDMVVVSSFNTAILTHELGHFFGLIHTYGTLEYVTRLAAEGANCSTQGDRMCGTAADPYGLPGNTCTNPNNPCTFYDGNSRPGKLNGDVFMPPYENFMSDFLNTANTFVIQQKALMDKSLIESSDRSSLLTLNGCENKTIAIYGNITGLCQENNPLVEATQYIKNYSLNVDNLSNNTPAGSTYFINVINSGDTYYSNEIPNGNAAIKPSKYNDWLNGVTTLDVSKISKHTLDIQLLSNSYSKLAADVNNDGEINGADMIWIRKLILGQIQAYPNNVGSYRFVPAYYMALPSFANQFNTNPFTAVYTNGSVTKSYSIGNSVSSYLNRVELDLSTTTGRSGENWKFLPVKMGDVNCSMSGGGSGNSVVSGLRAPASYRYPMTTNIRNSQVKAQRNVTLALKGQYDGKISSFQVGLKLSPTKFQLKKILKGDFKMNSDEFDSDAKDNGEIKALWYDNKAKNKDFTEGVTLMKFKVKSLENIQDILNELKIDDLILENAFYDADGMTVSVNLSLEIDETEEAAENPYSVKTYPSPFSNELNFEIQTPQNEEATITLYNAFGRVISTVKTNLNVGANIITISNTNTFPIGALSYTVKTSSQLLNGTLNRIR